MPPKRGKVGGSSAKTPTQPRAKRTRRVNTQAAALTGLKDSSYLSSEDVDTSIIVYYNESTPSPRSENECDGEATPPASSSLSTSLETASFTNAVSLSVHSSTATIHYSTALEGASASSIQTIHNGSDYEEPELKASLSIQERAQSISYGNRVSHGYVKGGI